MPGAFAIHGAFVYRLGHGPLKAERRVRFPYALPLSEVEGFWEVEGCWLRVEGFGNSEVEGCRRCSATLQSGRQQIFNQGAICSTSRNWRSGRKRLTSQILF